MKESSTSQASIASQRGAPGSDALIVASDVASLLRIPRPTVYHLTRTGLLPSFRIGGRILYRLSEIQRVIGVQSWSEPVPRRLQTAAAKRGRKAGMAHHPAAGRAVPSRRELHHAGTACHGVALLLGWDFSEEAALHWMSWCLSRHWLPLMTDSIRADQAKSIAPQLLLIDGRALAGASQIPGQWLRLAEVADAVLIVCDENAVPPLAGAFLAVGPVLFVNRQVLNTDPSSLQRLVLGVKPGRRLQAAPPPGRSSRAAGNTKRDQPRSADRVCA
jgi:excisionase family DNA binding protein